MFIFLVKQFLIQKQNSQNIVSELGEPSYCSSAPSDLVEIYYLVLVQVRFACKIHRLWNNNKLLVVDGYDSTSKHKVSSTYLVLWYLLLSQSMIVIKIMMVHTTVGSMSVCDSQKVIEARQHFDRIMQTTDRNISPMHKYSCNNRMEHS